MISFSTGKLRKNLLWTNKIFFSFPTAQTENKSWTKLEKQIGEKL